MKDTQEGRWQFAVKRFKVEWEMPEMGPMGEEVAKFYQEDQETPRPKADWPDDVPWRKTQRESEDALGIQDQANSLKEMEAQGHPIRNIHVYTSEIVWSEVTA